MTKYIVETEWSGYSRGAESFEVEADSAEQAKEYWYTGKSLGRYTMRDDTEHEVESVKEVTDD